MVQYPNYSMNSYMPQYQVPMYQQPYQQPVIDRMAQLQAMQQNLQSPQPVPGISGRFVDDFGIITANDVPMDGNGAVFIKRDGSEIQIRNWTAQGTIATSRFKPFVDDQVDLSGNDAKAKPGLSDEAAGAFLKRFDDIEARFDRLEKVLKPLNRKKEIETDE